MKEVAENTIKHIGAGQRSGEIACVVIYGFSI
jgi:hypothetical protein